MVSRFDCSVSNTKRRRVGGTPWCQYLATSLLVQSECPIWQLNSSNCKLMPDKYMNVESRCSKPIVPDRVAKMQTPPIEKRI